MAGIIAGFVLLFRVFVLYVLGEFWFPRVSVILVCSSCVPSSREYSKNVCVCLIYKITPSIGRKSDQREFRGSLDNFNRLYIRSRS